MTKERVQHLVEREHLGSAGSSGAPNPSLSSCFHHSRLHAPRSSKRSFINAVRSRHALLQAPYLPEAVSATSTRLPHHTVITFP